jgi:hypothetical protein
MTDFLQQQAMSPRSNISSSTSAIEEQRVFKLVNKKMDYFFNQVNMILNGIINDLNFSVTEIHA